MPNRLNIPDDLVQLIEKRKQEDRRQEERDAEQNLTETDAPTSAKPEERRSGKDRRNTSDG